MSGASASREGHSHRGRGAGNQEAWVHLESQKEPGRGKVGGKLKVRGTIVKSSCAQARMSGSSCVSNRKPLVDLKQESKQTNLCFKKSCRTFAWRA